MMRFFLLVFGLALLFGCVSNSGATQNITQNVTQPQQSYQNTTPPSYEISYDSDGWTVYGSLYPSIDTPTRLIILIPGLGTPRTQYPQDFILGLHDAVPDALILAIDPKGHGKSTNLGTWQDFTYPQFVDLHDDVIDGQSYAFSKFPSVNETYVVGASMGSTSAILAAGQDDHITKVAMVSPGIGFNNVDITGSVANYSQPLLVVASEGDAYSLNSAYEISSMKPQASMAIYPGSFHGTALFDGTRGLNLTLSGLLIDFLSK